ncbi:MAG: hypothetical protein WA019_03315 [Candidatus Moraniibacteriota bacterium]
MNKKARGNGLVEFILWCFFLFPGIIYSIWSRGGSGKKVCPKCGSTTMIPTDTPMGQKLMAEQRNNPDIHIEPTKSKETSKTALYAMFVVLGIVFIFVIISFSTYKKDAEKAENEIKAQQTIQQNLPAVQDGSQKTKTK